MVCMGFSDYERFETPILQWYASNGRFVGVYSQRSLMPKNNSYEEAIPVLDAESGYANAIPLSEVKERLDITPFIVTIEHTADGYTADHYQDEIIAAYESGRVVYAMMSTAIFQLSGYSTTQGCNFVLLDAFEEMGETLPWMMRFVITTDSVLLESNTLLTASDKTEIKQELVTLSEEKADKEEPYELIESIVCDGTYGNINRRNVSYKKVKLCIHTTAAEASGVIGIEIYNNFGLFGYAWISGLINTAERWSYAEAVSDGQGDAYLEYTGPSSSAYGSANLS